MRLTALLLLSAAVPARAQLLPPMPTRYATAFPGPVLFRPLAAPGPKDHAWEGAKIGGAVLGLGGLGVGYGWCASGDSGHPTNFGYCAPRALIGGLAGATLGAVIGGFIGSAFPRGPESP